LQCMVQETLNIILQCMVQETLKIISYIRLQSDIIYNDV
jgi:hypothetical protein